MGNTIYIKLKRNIVGKIKTSQNDDFATKF